jgi:hypothetical protein
MSGRRDTVIAEFADAEALLNAARCCRGRGLAPIDALSPYRLEGVEEALTLPTSPVRWPMMIFGLSAAAFAYGLETFSAVFAYPFNSGGRPPNSWPVFFLAPFEFGVLIAAAAGLVAFLCLCGLPRLNHPIFDVEGVERGTADRFFLVFSAPAEEGEERRLVEFLEEMRAQRVEGTRR